MRITKFVHSCLLIETATKTVLIDPGKYSWDSHLLTIGKIERLDYIVITHEHSDHYHLPFLQALINHFPHSTIVTNSDLAKKISSEEVRNKIISGSEAGMQVFEADHEPLPMGIRVPLNMGVHIDEQFTHPGDAVHLSHTRNILALPVSAPWISLKQSLEAVLVLKPSKVIPIHDWHWHKQAREEQYALAEQWLLPHGIKFVALQNAVPVEL
ncbi:MBL fold metallo-hydrolase [Candidatus Saccharibacteria bacterium]|nr:MBL fold metallo-hydrolase [Candidatus Saccharibacteria bacterium]